MLIIANGVISNANASGSHPPLRELRIIQLVSPRVLFVVCPHSDSLFPLWRLISSCCIDRLLILSVELILLEVLTRGGRITFPLRIVQELVRFYATVGPALGQGTIVTYSKLVHS